MFYYTRDLFASAKIKSFVMVIHGHGSLISKYFFKDIVYTVPMALLSIYSSLKNVYPRLRSPSLPASVMAKNREEKVKLDMRVNFIFHLGQSRILFLKYFLYILKIFKKQITNILMDYCIKLEIFYFFDH